MRVGARGPGVSLLSRSRYNLPRTQGRKILSQVSVELDPELEQALAEYMKLRHIDTEAEALRAALVEVVEKERPRNGPDFSRWLGMGLRAPQNPEPRFRSDNDLWS